MLFEKTEKGGNGCQTNLGNVYKNDVEFFAPFSPRLASEFAKITYMTQEIFFFFKNQYGYLKTQTFYDNICIAGLIQTFSKVRMGLLSRAFCSLPLS